MADKKATLLLSAADVANLLELPECIAAVEKGFRALGENRLPPPENLSLHAKSGGLHIKAALWKEGREYFVAKANANFPQNPTLYGLPTIQGVIVISDAITGELLALLDSIEITALRTGAATAVAARNLARPNSHTHTVCGCGKQGMTQLQSILAVLPIRTVYAFDLNGEVSRRFVADASQKCKIEVRLVNQLAEAVSSSDVIVTCTPSLKYFIHAGDVRPGTFIAAVGADNEHKQEIDPALFLSSKVVVDSLSQCLKIGDLHHAVAAGTITENAVYAELAEMVAGHKHGRTSETEITIFDSTGIAIEDAAAAVCVFEKAAQSNVNHTFRF